MCIRDSGKLGSDCSGTQDHRYEGPPLTVVSKAGMCIHRTSKTDDDVSEIFHGVQPDRITGSDDQEYAGEWREQAVSYTHLSSES